MVVRSRTVSGVYSAREQGLAEKSGIAEYNGGMDWQLVYTMLVALGLFEIVKKTLMFAFDNNVVNRNLELRKIANFVLRKASWLKLNRYEKSLSPNDITTMYISLHKIADFDNAMAEDMMRLINYPVQIRMLIDMKQNDTKHLQTIIDDTNHADSVVDKLIIKCNKLRYQPIIDWKRVKERIIGV